MKTIQTDVCISEIEYNRLNQPSFLNIEGMAYVFIGMNMQHQYCYKIVTTGVGALRKKRRSVPPVVTNRVCTGTITFETQNVCDLLDPENIDVAFELNPLGEIFIPNNPCAVGTHNYARFSCLDTSATIRTKLLAALQPSFTGKVDFTVDKETLGTGFDNFVVDILVLPDGKIVVGGQFLSYNGIPSSRIIILNPDFSVFATAEGVGFNNAVLSMVLAPDGSGDIIVAGNFTDYNGNLTRGLIRLNPDLTVDTLPVGTGFDAPAINDIALLPNGDLVVVGGFQSYNGTSAQKIIILDSATFNIVQTSEGTGFNSGAQAVDIINGDIVVGGPFTDYNGLTSRSIIILEPTLASATSIRPSGFGFDTTVLDVKVNSSNQIVVGGIFSTYNGTGSNRIIILDSSLNLLTTAVGTGFSGGAGVQTITIQPNGDILAGGTFTDYNGTSSEGIIRLNSDLTIDTPAQGTGFTPANIFAIGLQNSGEILAGGFFFNYDGASSNHFIQLTPQLAPDVSALTTYTIQLTYTDLSSTPTPTSLLGTVLESCVIIENQTNMNLVCQNQ